MLKANHGNDMNLELQFPLAAEKRHAATALARRWLACKYGVSWGEWWYATIPPRLILEKHLAIDGKPLLDYKFVVVRGRVELIYVVRTHKQGKEVSIFGRDLGKRDVVHNGWPNLEVKFPESIAAMIEVAEMIGRKFLTIRVDLYDLDGAIGLGELTLCPGNAREINSPAQFSIDEGSRWQLP
jgi:hypothetical protein